MPLVTVNLHYNPIKNIDMEESGDYIGYGSFLFNSPYNDKVCSIVVKSEEFWNGRERGLCGEETKKGGSCFAFVCCTIFVTFYHFCPFLFLPG
jgi:hypothetical protein